MASKTTTPKKAGLAIARSKNKFVLTWSPIKDCTDQDVKIYENSTLKGTHDLSQTTKKYTHTITASNWYPNSGKKKLKKVGFKLARKQSGKKESSYSETKYFEIKAPGIPKKIPPVQDSEHSDTFAYSWARNSSDGDINTTHKMFTRYEWETCLVSKGKKPTWSLAKTQKITTIDPTTGVRSTNVNSYGTFTSARTSMIIVEKQADIEARKTRHFHIRAVGPAGHSKYQLTTHQLGGSDALSIPKGNINYIGSDSTGTSGSIKLDISKGNPNDSIQIQYAITTPVISQSIIIENGIEYMHSSISLADDFNSWEVLDTFTGAGKPDTYTFRIPAQVTNNNVLFMRINRIHDGITSLGKPALINVYKAKSETDATETITIRTEDLSAPVFSSLSVDEAHKTVNVAVNNTSGIDGSFIAVYQKVGETKKVIGIIPSDSQQTQSFPGDWQDGDEPIFGIKCLVADYTPVERASEGATIYTCETNILMSSDIVWQSDLVSKPPVITSLAKYDNTTAHISWEWNWSQADSAEISWSDNKIAWESNTEPSNYILTNTRNGSRYITGLSAGTYYFRVRFIRTLGETVTYGEYSDFATLVMSSAPVIPSLSLSDEDSVIAVDDEITAYWQYQSTDGTPQSFAQLAEATRANDSAPWEYTDIEDAITNTDTSMTFTPAQFGWTTDSQHYICVKVMSGSGVPSEGYSQPKLITVAPMPVISVDGIGGENDSIITVTDLEDEVDSYVLTRLPLEFSVSEVSGDGYCTVVIERAENYSIERPDDTDIIGFAGETIISETYRPDPESEENTTVDVSIDVDDLIGRLDNTAQYIMTVTVVDEYGQSVSLSYPFTVEWDHYAQMPSADIFIDHERDIAVITTDVPETLYDGDYCQLYRLSADTPQLILDHGEFGTSYVDIYPTFGYFGGYRIVYVTKYGDYKTEDNVIAMTEYSKSGNDQDIEQYDRFLVSIQFDDNLVEFPGNISVSNSWSKDFQATKYLGGSIEGDWNPGVQRTGSINGTVPVEQESDMLYGLRILADYAGICHVRTPEGSNFYGDIQVKDDREEKWVNKTSKISLSYTKVDWIEDELPTYLEWINNQLTT